MATKIKKIKDYLAEGPAQFEVLMRKKYQSVNNGEPITVYTSIAFLDDDGEEESGRYETTLEADTLIKQVRRLKDKEIFTYQDFVNINYKGEDVELYLFEFKEDLIHCVGMDSSFREFIFEIDEILPRHQHTMMFTEEDAVFLDEEGVEVTDEDDPLKEEKESWFSV